MEVLIVLNIFLILAEFCVAETSDTLELVHVVFRHGSRTPVDKDIYPNDPYKVDSFSPPIYGQLTKAGKQSSYKLGTILGNRYAKFLGEDYLSTVAEIYATDYDRTKMTAMLVSAGLFPPRSTDVLIPGLPWQPIPYNYLKDSDDYIFRRAHTYCPTYIRGLAKAVDTSTDLKNALKQNKENLEFISNHTGQQYKDASSIFNLYQTLLAEHTLNFTLPKWTQEIFPKVVTDLSVKLLIAENSTPLLRKLNQGRLLKKIIEHMVEKSKETLLPRDRKIYLYSGHEVNVFGILTALNLMKPEFPAYNSAVLIELHRIPGKDYVVRVLHLKDPQEPFRLQKLPGCDSSCPLDQFIELTKHHVPGNHTAECEANINLDVYDI